MFYDVHKHTREQDVTGSGKEVEPREQKRLVATCVRNPKAAPGNKAEAAFQTSFMQNPPESSVDF